MSEFVVIKTQEEFEKRLQDRLTRKEASVKKTFEGFISPDDLEKIKKDYETKITKSLALAETNASKKYEDFISPDDLEKIKADYDSKIAKFEVDALKTKIAIECNIPLNLRERLQGTTEEEIRSDAKVLSNFAKQSGYRPPLATTEPSGSSSESALLEQGFKDLLNNL